MNDSRNHNGYKNNEQRAKDQAYQEYLKLRENRKSRGNFVKDDTLYGSYYGNSSTKPKSEEDAGREAYLRARAEAKRRQSEYQQKNERQQIARLGRINKADKDKPVKGESIDGKNKKKLKKGEMPLTKGEKKKLKKKKNSRRLKIALVATLVLVLGIGGVIAAGLTAVKNTLDNVGRIEIDPDLLGINAQVDSDLRNYRNIALLGIDARDMTSDTGVRSDAMIVASINKETNEIKMFSVYRDTMLELGDNYGLDKVTHAYYYGGPTKALYALNRNLDLNIKEVVVVNWKSVADTIDALGGIDVEIQESEIDEMNKYIKDTYSNIGGSNAPIESAGMQTLNGNQAVTYARIRKDAITGDYRRNERMKIVVQAAFDKAKKMKIKTLEKISNKILPEIKTNMSSADMMAMILKLNAYSMSDSEGWPYETRGWTGNAWYGPPVTLESNVSKLHEQFFAQPGYIPTQDVQNISESISEKTGYY